MVKVFKKLVLLVAVLTVVATILSACSNDKKTEANVEKSKTSMDGYKVGDTFKAKKPVKFSILYSDHPNYPYKKDWLLWKEMKKRTNVTLKPTIVPMSDYEQKRSLLISSGDAPLIIPKTYPGQEAAFVSSGAILPVSDYIDKMPNFKEKVKKWNMQADLDTLRQEDGKFYVLPGLHEEIWPDYSLAVRTDIFKKNNIAIPKTWAELQSALKKLKEVYPDVTPFSDRWQMNSTLNIAATSFGTVAGWGTTSGMQYDESKDKYVFSGATKEYKDMVTYFHSLVEQGLLDKESLTQDDQQAIQKFVSGKSFVIGANAQELVAYRTSMDKNLGKGKYSIQKIMVPGGPAGQVMAGSRLENGIMINAKAKDDPNFDTMLQFIDWLWYSDEGEEFAKWGVEGTTYTKENGKRKLAKDVNYVGLNPSGTKALNTDFGFSGGVFAYGGTTELLQSTFSDEELKFQKEMADTKTPLKANPPYPLSEGDREQATLLSTPLKDMTSQNTLRFINGSRPLSEWDKYVSELKAKGMDKYSDLINKAYKDFKKKN
ncbi:extracellular solute-binding protein [Fictibacillus fluitans]|uniref:Extracellular solute-binding protein n=1 Tax=Fictibacillus fluitans TaxID=3058422 RepID=A0ABT8HW94_9BACL|nr:extracellular solute-binding protein [Fictibacillus sp. NE201]MDN4525024.1 extracellular solute-binding protein [Fictibacillus sp. NE201]